MGEFLMPSLGADMEAGTLIEWKVKEGDSVQRGDIIGEVETEKGDIDIEIFKNGIVESLLVHPGEKVPVGAVLATIRENEESETGEMPAPERRAPPADVPSRPRVRASPLARRIAEEYGIDLTTLTGSGPRGAIQRADVERTIEARGPEAAPEGLAKGAPLPERRPEEPRRAGMRHAIAGAMERSNREIPHYYLETRIDMSPCLEWLASENARRSVKERLLPVVLLVKAVAGALDDVPELNGYWLDAGLQLVDAVHIGFAVSLRQGGLVVPAIHHADSRGSDELMSDITDLILRAREGKLRSSELTDATITVTSLGDRGVESVYGVIYPPQVALVGFGKITEQPWAQDGMLAVRPVLTATLAADHRATDGHRGAQFLASVARRLQDPPSL